MIVVTGGAGFIGSALVWALNCRNRSNILIVDHLGESEKWRNLVPLSYIDYIEKDSFLQAMSSDALPDNITSVIHLGACTDPLEKNKSYLTESNFKFSQALASYCLNKHIRFIYASSAITYGKGQASLNDSEEKIEELRPTTPLAYSKQMFDMWAHKNQILNRISGLKFSHVFGPNEYHKTEMPSLITNNFNAIDDGKTVYTAEDEDKDYVIDLIYVKDAVEILLFLMDNPELNGLYNAGTGTSFSLSQISKLCLKACGQDLHLLDPSIELPQHYKILPAGLNMERLKKTGFRHNYRSLERALADYHNNYFYKQIRFGEE